MSSRKIILAAELLLLLGAVAGAMAQAQRDTASNTATTTPAKNQKTTAQSTPAEHTPAAATASPASSGGDPRILGSDESALRLEGEKRFQANCGRCHMAPPKFPPRAMATVLRHMRVRALITDEDRKLILHYMTE